VSGSTVRQLALPQTSGRTCAPLPRQRAMDPRLCSPIAVGPGAEHVHLVFRRVRTRGQFGKVMVEMADSSGSDAGSITSWSITTDVSRSPLVSSVIDALIYHRIEIGTKPTGVDPGSANRSFGNGCSGHESARPNRPQFRDGRAIAGHHNRSARLHLAKHGCRLIAKLALRDLAVHGAIVALVAQCSKITGSARSVTPIAHAHRQVALLIRSIAS